MLTKIPHTKKKLASAILNNATNIREFHVGIDRIHEHKMSDRFALYDEWSRKKHSTLYINEQKKEGTLNIVDNRWYEFNY
jgi:hypothetical protein